MGAAGTGIPSLLALLALQSAAPTGSMPGGERPAAAAYVVIVHPKNPARTVDRKFLADAFLKKTTRWEHGGAVVPVDLGARSATRSRFSEGVLNRTVAAVRSYWQQMIFSGRGIPPPEMASDGDVVVRVLADPGAVGYVSAAADLRGAKVVAVE